MPCNTGMTAELLHSGQIGMRFARFLFARLRGMGCYFKYPRSR